PMLWPLVVYLGAVIAVAGGMLGLSYLLGERHRSHATGEPYESGFPVTGSARLRLDVQFYIVAMFFVIFDLETMFIVAWAVALRDVGWAGYLGGLVFILVLAVALLYEWRIGALDWATSGRPRHVAGRERD